MIKSFKHKGLRRLFEEGIRSGVRPDHVNRLRLILSRLEASMRPQDMALPGLRLHPLKGSLKGFYSVNVSGNWRVIFKFEGINVVQVDYIDYH